MIINNLNMSIRPTEIKDPMYEPAEESNMSESEIKKAEVKKRYYFIILFIAIDYIITICIILHESKIFTSSEKNNYIYLIINAACLTLFFLFVIISLLLYRVCLAKVIKYLYMILLGAYFFYLLIMKIIYFVRHFDKVGALDYVFLGLLLVTIVPRVLFFCYIDGYIINLVEKYECQKGEEHEDFRQNLENKMERGDDTNWSKTSLPNDPKRISN